MSDQPTWPSGLSTCCPWPACWAAEQHKPSSKASQLKPSSAEHWSSSCGTLCKPSAAGLWTLLLPSGQSAAAGYDLPHRCSQALRQGHNKPLPFLMHMALITEVLLVRAGRGTLLHLASHLSHITSCSWHMLYQQALYNPGSSERFLMPMKMNT